jgi:hypothetical protein
MVPLSTISPNLTGETLTYAADPSRERTPGAILAAGGCASDTGVVPNGQGRRIAAAIATLAGAERIGP